MFFQSTRLIVATFLLTSFLVPVNELKSEVILLDDFSVGRVEPGEQVWTGGEILFQQTFDFEQSSLDTAHVASGQRHVTAGIPRAPETGFATIVIGGDDDSLFISSTDSIEEAAIEYEFDPPLDLSAEPTAIEIDGIELLNFGYTSRLTDVNGVRVVNNSSSPLMKVSDFKNSDLFDPSRVAVVRVGFQGRGSVGVDEFRIRAAAFRIVPEPSANLSVVVGMLCLITAGIARKGSGLFAGRI